MLRYLTRKEEEKIISNYIYNCQIITLTSNLEGDITCEMQYHSWKLYTLKS